MGKWAGGQEGKVMGRKAKFCKADSDASHTLSAVFMCLLFAEKPDYDFRFL